MTYLILVPWIVLAHYIVLFWPTNVLLHSPQYA